MSDINKKPDTENLSEQTSLFLSTLHGNLEDRYIFSPWKTDGVFHESKAFDNTAAVIESLQNGNDCYVSVNEFGPVFDSIRRKQGYCKTIKAVFIDLDLHKETSAPVEQLIGRVKECMDGGDIPCPTFVIHTGRGLALHYIYKEGIPTTDREATKMHEDNYSKIFARLKVLLSDVADIDTTVKDFARICRLPGTYNSKAGEYAGILEYNSECVYTVKELYDGFHLETVEELVKTVKNKPAGKGTGRGRKREYADDDCVDVADDEYMGGVRELDRGMANAMRQRAKDLEEWLCECNGLCYTRELFLFIYLNTQLHVMSINEAVEKTREINEMFDEPLEQREVNTTIRNLVNRGELYHLSNEYISEKLGTNRWHHGVRVFKKYVPKIASRKERARRRALIHDAFSAGMKQKDLAEGFGCSLRLVESITAADVDERREDRDSQIRDLYGKRIQVSKIAEIVGCSRGTVYNVLNCASAYARKKNCESIKKCSKTSDSHNIEKGERGGQESREVPLKFGSERLAELYRVTRRLQEDADPHEKEEALAILESGTNACILGNGGTGKSYLINQFYESLSVEEQEKTLMLAYTGKAASNLPNGRTIHSAFELKRGVINEIDTMKVKVPKKLYGINRVIIDEIGTVRIDVFNHIMKVIRKLELMKAKKIQVIVVGDFGQIKPVAKPEDIRKLKAIYPGKDLYCYEAPMWNRTGFKIVMLRKIERQKDKKFIEMLNLLKYGSYNALLYFNNNLSRRMSPDAVYICPTNALVRKYNNAALRQFKNVRMYPVIGGNGEGDVPQMLCFAQGARVMATRNDSKKGYVNGNMGVITELSDEYIKVLFDGWVAPVKIERVKYEDAAGAQQFPLQLAYAITVDKAQGMTFDEVNILPGYFAPGQLYVALTRCRKFENIHILGNFMAKELITDEKALAFGMEMRA